jgi:hypothetical protein
MSWCEPRHQSAELLEVLGKYLWRRTEIDEHTTERGPAALSLAGKIDAMVGEA